jgi:hypothetical protein
MMKKVTEGNRRRNEQCEWDLEVTMQSVIKKIAEIVTSKCDKKICLDMNEHLLMAGGYGWTHAHGLWI